MTNNNDLNPNVNENIRVTEGREGRRVIIGAEFLNRDELQRKKENMESSPDIGSAIMGHAYIETQLENALIAFLYNGPESEKYIKSRSFSMKMELCYSLQLINPTEKDTIEKISNIRNDFAHSDEIIDFTHDSIKSKCEELLILKKIEEGIDTISFSFDQSNPRQYFQTTVYLIWFILNERIRRITRIDERPLFHA